MRTETVAHNLCGIEENCGLAGCPAVKAVQKRERDRGDAEWSSLQLCHEGSSFRHYLDGEPISCGARLELQAWEEHHDDYGSYSIPRHEALSVRYELSWQEQHPDSRVRLHYSWGCHEFVSGYETNMRFRWPQRGTW